MHKSLAFFSRQQGGNEGGEIGEGARGKGVLPVRFSFRQCFLLLGEHAGQLRQPAFMRRQGLHQATCFVSTADECTGQIGVG